MATPLHFLRKECYQVPASNAKKPFQYEICLEYSTAENPNKVWTVKKTVAYKIKKEFAVIEHDEAGPTDNENPVALSFQAISYSVLKRTDNFWYGLQSSGIYYSGFKTRTYTFPIKGAHINAKKRKSSVL